MATVIKTPDARRVDGSEFVPVYIWQLPVRIVHWMIVLCLIVLSLTGFYLHNPFLVAIGPRAWVMGTARFVHELFGFILIATLVLRFYWFFAGNQWAHWRAWIPLRREQWRNIRSMILYYTFLKHDLEPEVGHNSLAAATYIVINTLLIWECISGLVLYGTVSGSRTLMLFVGWIPRVIDIQYIRASHFFIMFLFMAFVIHHVYSAMVVSAKLRNGLMESIFTGRKFLPLDMAAKLNAPDPKDRKRLGRAPLERRGGR
jgi:Ni/Fe-hydrogenase 1 B-type cytochrome subunit